MVEMVAKVEMSLGEWVVRMTCKLLAFGVAILGLGGFAIFGMTEVTPTVVAAKYDVAICVAIGCVAVLFGVTPMAVEVDRALLRVFRLMPAWTTGHSVAFACDFEDAVAADRSGSLVLYTGRWTGVVFNAAQARGKSMLLLL